MDTFGSRLVAARKSRGLAQKELAEQFNITPTCLNYWEKDKREPNIEMIKALATTLHVSADYLIGVMLPAPDADAQIVIDTLGQLNEVGRVKLMDYASDLVASGNYKKHDSDQLANEA